MPATPLTLRALRASALDLPLCTPFGIAGGAQDLARNVLVTVELSDGSIGFGEAAPFPAYNGETQADALAVLAAATPALRGQAADLGSWRTLAHRFHATGGHASGSAQCGFEMALLDALTRHAGLPLWRFFGGAGTTLETDMTVTTGTPEQSAADARAILARGIRQIKVKVGGPAGPTHDLARLAAIHAIAPGSPLILDGNAGLTRAAAAELAPGLAALDIRPALLEQWLAKDDFDGARALAESTGWRLAADEAAVTADDVPTLVATRAAQVVNIKLMKAGVAAALDLASAARAHGLGLMIGGNVESSLAMTFSACFAAGLGGFEFADLDTPLFLASEPFNGGLRYEGSRVSVAHVTAGHGVQFSAT